MSFQAYVLIGTVAEATDTIFQELKEISEVINVHVVTGPYDIIAFLEADDPQLVGEVILSKIRQMQGIIETLTCVVVR